MQPMPWSMSQIKQCEKESGQAMLSDEHALASYAQDFGKLNQVIPSAVCIPSSIKKLQSVLAYANQHNLNVTIRGNGLSQGGQALAQQGSLIMHLEQLNHVQTHEQASIWVEANATWSSLVEVSLKKAQIPYVLPYNCNLSIGGVLSAGGVGSSSFKFGSISSHVKALEVTTADGKTSQVDEQSELFHACLSGQGRFAVITKACIKLRPCLKQVRTFFLVYLDKNQWLHDLADIKSGADYVEAFCSPSLQGAKLTAEGKRLPFAQWLFALHISLEYDSKPPQLNAVSKHLKPWKTIHIQDESIHSYLHRHNSRFEVMKLTGQWDLLHPWYECFIPTSVLSRDLEELLTQLPIHYATVLQIVPLANERRIGFLMLPDSKDICALMILNPGVNPVLLPSCLQAMTILDEHFLQQGGKRYLSGYLGQKLAKNYWQTHFGPAYGDWLQLKKKYDPRHILTSSLHYL
ncbi:FAD-binding protein [Legionella feeleii]|uniref:Cytokinin oxidase n=1 Tax=Legionella feeleii TaxID=453 RepID=A0A0W0U8Z2_9GAMM|nr:FAD-binding protein [Legionella feeleii]KTD04368.1 cytokinin oxidase [Legionella feeleii]SPX62836.1 cytokinin oxidase [Legionella feeleii]